MEIWKFNGGSGVNGKCAFFSFCNFNEVNEKGVIFVHFYY